LTVDRGVIEIYSKKYRYDEAIALYLPAPPFLPPVLGSSLPPFPAPFLPASPPLHAVIGLDDDYVLDKIGFNWKWAKQVLKMGIAAREYIEARLQLVRKPLIELFLAADEAEFKCGEGETALMAKAKVSASKRKRQRNPADATDAGVSIPGYCLSMQEIHRLGWWQGGGQILRRRDKESIFINGLRPWLL
jgi:hypothetical protein